MPVRSGLLGRRGQRAAVHRPQGKARARTREGLGLYKVAGRAEDSPGASDAGLHAGGGEEKAQSSPSLEEKVGGSGEPEPAPGRLLPAGESGSATEEGQGQFREWGQVEKGRG